MHMKHAHRASEQFQGGEKERRVCYEQHPLPVRERIKREEISLHCRPTKMNPIHSAHALVTLLPPLQPPRPPGLSSTLAPLRIL